MKITKALLTPNSYSRPQIKLAKVTHIVIHWIGNANTSAQANRNYFESLKIKKIYASSHYIVGLNGEILQCVPENEVAYHANSANSYSIGIENCHPDWGGKLNEKTYESLIELCVDICTRYQLDPEKAMIRHYDVTKKICPKYYVEHMDAWLKLKQDVKNAMYALSGDQELLKALNGLIASGILLDVKVWGSVETMNMKYAKTMVERIGQKFGQTSYKGAIDFFVDKGCINTRSVWDQEKFKAEWCRGLIIKVYQKLIA